MLRTATTAAIFALGVAVTGVLVNSASDSEMVPIRLADRVLAVAVNEVTVAQWRACSDAGACEAIAGQGEDADSLPITGVNWFDVQAYISWANAAEGRHFRLPTAEEWRLISGKPMQPKRKPLFDDPRMAWAASYGQEDTPAGPVRLQGTWSTSRDGIHDLEGNVWEWTASCNSATQDPARCAAMHVMGAHDAVMSVFVRDPESGGCATGKPPTHIGFRLVEDPS
ncbi:MAG: formylglycine-generating enzyme family protein [Phyllobacteriaceae bacterium]|nr:formylglycine-generating enzyme family protein [Phyllobacteriaceae bacterium]